MNNRRAFTLVEMSVSIAVGSVLMGLALGMVHRTMRAESTARINAQVERTAARLSRQFRHDLHQAQSISLDNQQNDTPSLRLVLSDQRPITYQIDKSSILREQQQSDEQTHREIFLFPDDYSLLFGELGEPSRVVLTVEHDTKLVGISPQVRLHVEAVVGQFLRLSQTEGASQ
ncbi:MAG: prepilin-type N-terminal cleavage/methylation domain-containing protein [Planctomycetes bacterium]|nr:prepilin-type N-terminal cleavage/methylation domain-containing protein [Planctomycetota bacterium]